MKKVLVGIVTYAGHKHCRELLFRYLASLTYQNIHYVICTNSGEEDARDLDARTENLRARGTVAVLTDDLKSIEGEAAIDNSAERDASTSEGRDVVVSGRNKVREYFLAGDYEYLFFLDDDVIGPRNAIEVLISRERKLVTGWYLAAFDYEGKGRVMPVAYAFEPGKPGYVRHLSLKHILTPRFAPIACAGLGCVLIARELLEKIKFRREEGTEDATFYEDARAAGAQLWLDTRLSYWHLKFPPGDERNNILDPRRYALKKSS